MLSSDVRLSGNESVSNWRFGFELSVAFGHTIRSANTGDITAASQSVFLIGLISVDVTSYFSIGLAC